MATEEEPEGCLPCTCLLPLTVRYMLLAVATARLATLFNFHHSQSVLPLVKDHPHVQLMKVTIIDSASLPLLREGVGRLLGNPAFTENLRVVCRDDRSYSWCLDMLASPTSCSRPLHQISDGEESTGALPHHSFFKWKVLRDMLQEGPRIDLKMSNSDDWGVLFLSADMLVFGSPGSLEQCVLRKHPKSQKQRYFVDLQYQSRETGFDTSVLWLRHSSRVLAFVEDVWARRREPGTLRDADWAERLLGERYRDLHAQPLPPEAFASLCANLKLNRKVSARARAFQPSCLPDNVLGKLEAMRKAREQRAEGANWTSSVWWWPWKEEALDPCQ